MRGQQEEVKCSAVVSSLLFGSSQICIFKTFLHNHTATSKTMEKYADNGKEPALTGTELSGSNSPTPIDWMPPEEKALVWKIDLIVMPLLMAVFFALQLDRGNIGNALTDNFLKDVGISQANYNVGQQLLSVGIVLLEVSQGPLTCLHAPQLTPEADPK